MRFSEVLDHAPRLRDLGDTTLRYESSLLIGEARPRPRPLAPVLWVAAFAIGTVAVVAAVQPGTPLSLDAALAVLAAVLLFVSTRMDQQHRSPRRFILNFATETLRLEDRGRRLGRPTTRLVPFDAVKALNAAQHPDARHALTVTFTTAKGKERTAILVDGVRGEEEEELEHAQRFLSAALGLTPE